MNALINVKTAEKRLQFGIKKCKTMLVGKNTENCLNSELEVDSWKAEYKDDLDTGELELVEKCEGKIPLEKTEEHKYLGFVLSSKGDNMANIRQLKQKSVGVIRQIFNKLKSLNLGKYYFECALIFMNCMLRGSNLYASETYYNINENEMRQIERIEEDFLRQLFKTTKGCPLSQLYLESGQIPARFEVKKKRLLFLKYILNQTEESTVSKVFVLQIEQPKKGDWASSCMKDLEYLDISLSLDSIREMTKN